jgi:hypothetical protein
VRLAELGGPEARIGVVSMGCSSYSLVGSNGGVGVKVDITDEVRAVVEVEADTKLVAGFEAELAEEAAVPVGVSDTRICCI